MALQNIILKNLQNNNLLIQPRQMHVLAAYSGGIDSTVMVHALSQLRQHQALTITAVYYDHGWRGAPPAELPVIHQNCQYWNVPLILLPANRQIPITETAAREARYAAILELGSALGVDAVLTAHQADDQIETIMFRILRGTGIDGLTGIRKKMIFENESDSQIPVLRPMLDIYREGIRRYAEQHQLRYFEDPANENKEYQRVLLRQEVIPFLQHHYPNLKSSLLRLATVSEGDSAIIEDVIDSLWPSVYEENGLNIVFFNQLGRPYQRRIIKRFLNKHHIDIHYERIEDIIDFIQGKNRRNLASALMSLEKSAISCGLEKNRFLSLYKNRLTLLSIQKKVSGEQEAPLSPAVRLVVPGETPYPALDLKVEVIPYSESESASSWTLSQDQNTVYVDLSQYLDPYTDTWPMEIRTRRPKDRIQPLGMSTSMRFKNYLINRGIPRFKRQEIPLLASGENILWAPGVGLSETLRIVDKPTHLIKVQPLTS